MAKIAHPLSPNARARARLYLMGFTLAAAAAGMAGCTPSDSGGTPGTGGSGGGGSGGAGGRGTGGGSGGSGGGGSGGSGGQSGGSGAGGATAGTGGAGGNGGAGGSGGGAGGASGGAGGGGGAAAGGTGGGGSGGSSGAGGGSSDGPAGEAPGTNPPGDTCGGLTTKYCDDWESQTVGMPPAGDFAVGASGGASVVVDGAQHFSGTKSLHFKSSGGGRVMLKFTKQFPLTGQQHGRLMVYMPTKPTTNSHWDMVQSHSSAPNHWELGGMYGNFELVVDPPDNGIDSKTPFPSGTAWHCIQWNFQNPAGVYVAKLDGQLVNPSPVMNRWKSGNWTDLTVGWEIFGSGAAEFWIDDLAFGEQEIPCPAK